MGMSLSELIVVIIVLIAVFKPEKLKEWIGKIKPAMDELKKNKDDLSEAVKPAKDMVDDIVKPAQEMADEIQHPFKDTYDGSKKESVQADASSDTSENTDKTPDENTCSTPDNKD